MTASACVWSVSAVMLTNSMKNIFTFTLCEYLHLTILKRNNSLPKVKMSLLFKKTKKTKKGGEEKTAWKTNVCLQGLNRVKEALCVDSALNYESEPALRLLLLTLNTPSLDGCFHQKSVPTPTPAAGSGSNLKWCAAARKSQHSVSQWRKARLDFSG